MFIKLLRWIIGYVDFMVVGKFPERFINIVSKNDISIFNVHKKGDVLYASLHIRDYRKIRPYAKKSRVRLRVYERVGLPFYLRAHKNRIGVVIGVAIFIAIISVMSCFVFTINVTGLEKVSYTRLMSALEDNGLYVGTYKNKVDFQTIARNTMLEIEEIGWMSINVVGSHASVELKEKAMAPKIKEKDTPANVKADCDGVILSIDTLSGTAYFTEGSAVVEGQLLVSGVVEDSRGAVSLVRADARVVAQTTHKKQYLLRKDSEICSFLPYKKRKKLSVFGLSVPISTVFADDKSCAKRYLTQHISIFDTVLPFGTNTQFLYEKKNVSKNYSSDEATLVFKNNSVLFQCFNLSDCAVQSTESKMYESDDYYIFDVTYTCVEDIAKVCDIDADNLVIEEFVKKENDS